MSDQDCVRFLQWALPYLNMRWPGFRKVRAQVCKRIRSRMTQLELNHIDQYKAHIQSHLEEWSLLDEFCQITISRFYRDKRVFDVLSSEILPHLCALVAQRHERLLRCWHTACASGEEPYTMSLIWDHILKKQFLDIDLEISASDINPLLLQRAKTACYSGSSIRELPEFIKLKSFSEKNNMFWLHNIHKEKACFFQHDIREKLYDKQFHLIFCRYLLFTYYDDPTQRKVLKSIVDNLIPGGILVFGAKELIPEGYQGLKLWSKVPGLYQKVLQNKTST